MVRPLVGARARRRCKGKRRVEIYLQRAPKVGAGGSKTCLARGVPAFVNEAFGQKGLDIYVLPDTASASGDYELTAVRV